MRTFIARRLLFAIPTLFGVVILTFSILHLAPGDPAQVLAGPHAPEEAVERIRQRLGLDQPFHVQLGRYLMQLARGDLGESLTTRRPVISEVARTLPNTIELVVPAAVGAVLLSIPVGVFAAVWRRTGFDQAAIALSLLGLSFPVFFTGIMLLYIFAIHLGWFPIGGKDGSVFAIGGWRYVVLPAATLILWQVAYQARIVRSNMLEVLREDYIRTARSKGLSERVVLYKHALKNALIPFMTVVGLQLGIMLSGTVVTETIYTWPGLGRLLVNAILTRDFPTAQGVILIIAVMYVGINLVVDLTYGWLDPRIRYD
ncbi:MAG TPA: ABC transporter permease [Bacillota bacterium]